MAKLVCVQLETNDHNTDGIAWFAYVEDKERDVRRLVTPKAAQKLAQAAYDDEDSELVVGGALGAEFTCKPEELPTVLSKHTGLRRFFVADAV